MRFSVRVYSVHECVWGGTNWYILLQLQLERSIKPNSDLLSSSVPHRREMKHSTRAEVPDYPRAWTLQLVSPIVDASLSNVYKSSAPQTGWPVSGVLAAAHPTAHPTYQIIVDSLDNL